MKKMSIKMKVTLWYTVVLAVMFAIILILVINWIDKTGLSVTEEELQGSVTGFWSNITFENDTYYVESDTEFYDDGVMFCIYDENGIMLHGSLPSDFPADTVLWDDNAREITADDKEWLVYDSMYVYSNGKVLWVRGITSIHNMEESIRNMTVASAIIFPAMVILIGIVGYLMIRRALKPVDEISDAAERISAGSDLSARIPEGKAQDEILCLTKSFNEMFERLQQSFDNEKQFTSDVSHELRTPVSIMISQCELLLMDESLTTEQREQVQVLLNQSKKMSKLISQLLYMAKQEKKINLEDFEEVDFGILAEMVCEEMQSKAQEKSIEIKTELDDNLVLWGDQTLLMRMLMNLISNAITYGKENGHILVSVKRQGDNIHGKVSDDGIGIEKEHLDKIWNRFYRVDKSRNGEGTGLGLSMVRWIVNAHGGTITVVSVPGRGTDFEFELPMKVGTDSGFCEN